MSLIQPLKFRTLKTECFKMPHLQMVVFQMGVTVASGQGIDFENCKRYIIIENKVNKGYRKLSTALCRNEGSILLGSEKIYN